MTAIPHNPIAKQTANVLLFEPPTSENIDISSAANFGRILYLFKPERGRKSRAGIWETDILCREILDRLIELDYEPTRDFLCISGHQVATSILIAITIREYGTVNALFFDTRERSYVARTLGTEFPFDESLE